MVQSYDTIGTCFWYGQSAASLSGATVILNNSESNSIYFSANASTFLMPTLELGKMLWVKYKYISLKYKLFKYPA